jgi:hypothetical protein
MALDSSSGDFPGEFNGEFECYVCVECGYTEFYVKHPWALKPDALPGATRLKAGLKAGRSTPYR